MNKFQIEGGQATPNHDGTVTETRTNKAGKQITRNAYSIHPGRYRYGRDYDPRKNIDRQA